MYKTVLTIYILLFSLCLQAQRPFADRSYKTALKEARQKNKLIFLSLESAYCTGCNDSMNRYFSNKERKAAISSSFIPLSIGPHHNDRAYITESLNIEQSSGVFFIDKNEQLIYSSKYRRQGFGAVIKEARKRAESIAVLEQKEKSYFNRNQKNIGDLEQIIQAKTDLEQNTGLLLVEYLNLLPKDTVNSIHVLQFLAQQAPIYRSKTCRAMRNASRFNEAWYALPQEQRVRINRRIFQKSIRVAAQNRNDAYANDICRFARGTYSDEEGKAYIEGVIMMNYYRQTQDTSRYLAVAAPFYDRYLTFVSNKTENTMADTAQIAGLPETLQKMRPPSAVIAPYIKKEYAHYLYTAAHFFYKADRQNRYMNHALRWAEESVLLFPHYRILHLYALLLYKTGISDKAIEYQALAIEKSKPFPSVGKGWDVILNKMKQGLPLE
ncbi:DUF255 domain-containing protein [Niabella aurantiaca]|uniref:DUF255 domain-containing protein n=1 Tax=Niabella aurantiaca TaxID=379900 RepID=UPI000370B447|nr:DUF255 domain-containing protein [Niabella aurantiaca]